VFGSPCKHGAHCDGRARAIVASEAMGWQTLSFAVSPGKPLGPLAEQAQGQIDSLCTNAR
jgi:hypothetical protein